MIEKFSEILMFKKNFYFKEKDFKTEHKIK